MPTKIAMRCPGCKARIKAPVELLGHHRKCPGCATPFIVQSQPPQDSDVALVVLPRAYAARGR
jgi:hypothetical protein